jgi:hypothetical protein
MQMALRLLLANSGSGSGFNNDVTSSLFSQRGGNNDLQNLSSHELQYRLLEERLRAAEAQDPSSDFLRSILSQDMGGSASGMNETALLQARLMAAENRNSSIPQQQFSSETNLSDQQLLQLYLMEQQRNMGFGS